jgi:hypothetical protein
MMRLLQRSTHEYTSEEPLVIGIITYMLCRHFGLNGFCISGLLSQSCMVDEIRFYCTFVRVGLCPTFGSRGPRSNDFVSLVTRGPRLENQCSRVLIQ